MEISSRVVSSGRSYAALVETDGRTKPVPISRKAEGAGSSVNGGELLFLALATCYCNDVYREAAAEGLLVDQVEVSVTGQFGGRGEPAHDIGYSVRVESPEDPGVVEALLRETDRVAEIQNTLRLGMPVALVSVEVLPSRGLTV